MCTSDGEDPPGLLYPTEIGQCQQHHKADRQFDRVPRSDGAAEVIATTPDTMETATVMT